ncbi:MAG: hypothetical protein GY913_24325 [Proteobacteria bacterium]|nr:hypothetical protein [Pseudomonadota bacterium]MCP4920042.1 hypothetical protein [Pseudomonadota bacterium]
MRVASAGLGLTVLTLAVRLAWFPVTRHRFDGHEADYLAVFEGAAWEGSTRLVPALAGLYQALGWLFDSPWVLVGLSVLAGLVTVLAVAGWAGRRFGFVPGVVAGALVALSPEHAAWSLSAYNVALPHALLAVALWVGTDERERVRWAGTALYALACSMRMELAFLAPFVALMAGWRASIGALGGLAGIAVMGTAPELRPVSQVLPINVQLVAFLGPCLVPALVGASRRTVALLGAALGVHLVGSCFDDYGARHALLGAVALIGVVAGLEDRRKWVVWGLALLASLWSVYQTADSYYVRSFDVPELGPPPPCDPILDDPLAEGSHWDDWPADPCWGEEFVHHAWTSRALQDRSLRMHTAYVLEPIGVEHLPGGPRVIYSVR